MTLSWKDRLTELVLLLVLSVCLPTLDSYGDIFLAYKTFSIHHPFWGCALLVPAMVNLCFTAVAWWKMDAAAEKRWSWVLLVFFLWPQYKAVKLIYKISWMGRETGLEEKNNFRKNVGQLEPFLESMPQILVKTALWGRVNSICGDKENITTEVYTKCIKSPEYLEASKVLGDDGAYYYALFFLIISIASVSAALASFLKAETTGLVSAGWSFRGCLTFLLFTVSAGGILASKAQLLAGMVWVPRDETDWDPRLLGALYGLAWISLLILPNLIVTGVSFGFWKSTIATFLRNPALVAVSIVSIFTLRQEGGVFTFSLLWTCVNMVVTIAGHLSAFAVLGSRWGWSWKWYEVTFELGYSLFFGLLLLTLAYCCKANEATPESSQQENQNEPQEAQMIIQDLGKL